MALCGETPDDFFEEVNSSFYLCRRFDNIDLVTNYKLPMYHKDPFDRFLIWDAIRSDFVLISVDKDMGLYKKEGLKVMALDHHLPAGDDVSLCYTRD